MSFTNISVINVYYAGREEKILVGRLAMKEWKFFFEYSQEFLQTGLELSPFKLPLKPGISLCEERVFDGLFGIFNDSLPDGWGRLLMDRKLMKLGVSPGALSPLDRLCYVGSHGMGALVYEPEIDGATHNYHDDLDEIADDAFQFQEYDDDRFVDDLLIMNGSSAGARPKILINLIDNRISIEPLPQGDPWIIKFRSSIDPKDNGSIEYAYHLMAKAAGLNVPEARLFPSKKGAGYFGVRRFDRINSQESLHMHSLSGLLHIDHRIPSLSYENIMKATMWLTQDIHACEQQFRGAVFNVLAHNRDDHAKNFSFLMDKKGSWSVSPSYDLIFSSGPAGEHSTTIVGEGKNPKLPHFLKLAEVADIKRQKALEIIEEVQHAVSKWKLFADKAEVSQSSFNMIQKAFKQTTDIINS